MQPCRDARQLMSQICHFYEAQKSKCRPCRPPFFMAASQPSKLSPSWCFAFSPPLTVRWCFTLGCLHSQQPSLPKAPRMIRSLKHMCRNSSNVVVMWTDEQHLQIKHKLCLSVPLKEPLLLLQCSFWAQEMEEKPLASNYNMRTTSGPGPAVSSAWTFCGVT